MRYLIYCALFIFFSNVSSATETKNNIKSQQVETKINNIMKKYTIPGAVVIIYKNGKIHQYLFGVADTKTKTAITSNTIFEIGSVTKSFVGLLLAEDINNGNIGLNDHLGNYLNNKNASNDIKKITLLGLATHTSSLPYNAPNIPYNTAATPKYKVRFESFLHNWQSPYPLETAALYSNLGFSILGIALANNANTTLIYAMQKGILQPLNMSNTFFTVPPHDKSLYSQGYNAVGSPSRTPDGGLLPGGWALKSSANDMAKYLTAIMGLPNTPKAILDANKIAQTGYFKYDNGLELGLGFRVLPLNQISIAELLKVQPVKPRKQTETLVEKIKKPTYTANALIEKTGATNGFRAYIGVIPNQKIGVVILINKFIYDPHVIARTARELIFNK